ncbi:hypothetical protein BDZ91DRAFT_804725 [Kalaharituber pfeilii]|nr:hypothetical protein BDZ91DRAFT_804725 [Kalaharituber pfeilii]
MAGLGPIFCPKCEADKEREKIVSMVLSDEDVEIFCEGMRDVEGLGVDLEIEQDKREVFGLGSSDAGPLDQSEEGNGYYIPTEEHIPPNFAWDFDSWLVLKDPSVSSAYGSPAQAVSPQIVSTSEARSSVAGSPLAVEGETLEGWSSVLSAAEVLESLKEGGNGLIGLKVVEIMVLVFLELLNLLVQQALVL